MRHQTRHLMPCLCCFVLLAGKFQIAHAQKLQISDARYDTAWLPITEAQLKNGIANAGSNPVTMWQLMRRAVSSGQGDALYRVLKPLGEQELKTNTIKHPVFVAAYADAITRTNLATPAERTQARSWIDKAVATDVDQWFPLLVRAEVERYEDPDRGIPHSMRTLERAVALAPKVSFLHSELAWTYGSIKIYDQANKSSWLRKSLQQYQLATQLKPVSTQPYIGLLAHYKFYQPNAAKAETYRHKVLSLLPPGSKVNPEMRRFFSGFGIVIPASMQSG